MPFILPIADARRPPKAPARVVEEKKKEKRRCASAASMRVSGCSVIIDRKGGGDEILSNLKAMISTYFLTKEFEK
jgi:hypothetical protein